MDLWGTPLGITRNVSIRLLRFFEQYLLFWNNVKCWCRQ